MSEYFLLCWGPKLSRGVTSWTKLFQVVCKEILKIPNIFILFHLPQSLASTTGKNFYISSFNSFTLMQHFLVMVVFLIYLFSNRSITRNNLEHICTSEVVTACPISVLLDAGSRSLVHGP